MVHGRTPQIRESIDDLVQRALVVELGIVVALFVGFYAFTIALESVLDPYFLDSDVSLLVVRSVLVLVGMGLLATSYAAWRGHSLPVSPPERTDGRLIGVAVTGTALLAVLPFVLLALRVDVGISQVASTLSDLDGIFLDRTLIRLALFVSGMVLLYHGLVQEALQRVFGHERDLAVVVTTLLGGYLVTPTVLTYGTFANGPWLFLWGTRAVVAVLFVVALGVAVYADERSDDDRVRALALLPVLATLTLAVLVLAVEAGSPSGALVVMTRAVVVGVAAYVYDGTESLLSPTLVYATFAIVSTVLHSAAVAAALGT
jgi:hypothetical protein